MVGKRSLRGLMISFAAVLLFAGFVVTNVASYIIASDAMRSSIIEHDLPLTGSNIYSEIQTDLVRPILVSSLMANDTFLQDWLKDGERDISAITRYLQKIRSEYQTFTAFLVSRTTLTYYHFSAASRRIEPNDPADIWFFRSIDAQEPYEVNVDINQQQNKAITVFINYRVLDHSGKMIGLTGVGLDFSEVRNIVSRYRAEFNRNIYFIDRSGRIVIGTDTVTPVGATIADAEGLAGIASAILSEDHGEHVFERNGRRILLSQRLIPALGWRVMVEQDEADALRPLWLGFLSNLAIGSAVALIVLVIVGLSFRSYHARLRADMLFDGQTGLGTRALIEQTIGRLRDGKSSKAGPISLILLNLDRFGDINEQIGLAEADRILTIVARAIQAATGDALAVARVGGDEFAVLAPGGADRGLRLSERLLRVIGDLPAFGTIKVDSLAASAGVAEIGSGEATAQVFGRAAQALRRAKVAGGRTAVAG